MAIIVSFATTDEESVAIHHFLCQVAAPFLPGRIDQADSIREVWRVVHSEAALIAWSEAGEMIGTLGIVCVKPWWGSVKHLANRWFFTLPRSGAGKHLLKEAKRVAVDTAMELHIIAEDRGKLTIINRSKLRSSYPGLANSPNNSLARAT